MARRASGCAAGLALILASCGLAPFAPPPETDLPGLDAAVAGWGACQAAVTAGKPLEDTDLPALARLTAGDIALYPPGMAGPLRPWWVVNGPASGVGVIDSAQACLVAIKTTSDRAPKLAQALRTRTGTGGEALDMRALSPADRDFIAALPALGAERAVVWALRAPRD